MVEEHASGRKERHPAGRAGEERRPDLLLERADLAADRRLRHVEAVGGTPDVALFGDRGEVSDLGEAHAPSLPPARSNGKAQRQIETVLEVIARSLHQLPMAIEILGSSQIERMRRAGRAAAETLAFVGSRLRAGMSTAEIDRLVREDTARRGGTPSQLGYEGFPAAVCTSRNHVVCHGIPSEKELLESGDIINVDVTTNLDGFHGDTSAMFVIGEASAEARAVVDVARRCRDAGIAVIREGARLGDIGAAVDELARSEGMSVVREIGGHGIGRRMHAEPHVAHTGRRGAGIRLRAGMAITVEPMINVGGAAVRFLDDGWTVVTADGSLSAQWEHTVLVTKTGYEVLTQV